MVILQFRAPASCDPLLTLTVAYSEPVQMDGDYTWLDFSFEPISRRYGRPISWQEDCEEWTRSLVEAYADTPLHVDVLHDDRPLPTAAPASASITTPMPEPQAQGSVVSWLRGHLLLVALVIVVVAFAAWRFVG